MDEYRESVDNSCIILLSRYRAYVRLVMRTGVFWVDMGAFTNLTEVKTLTPDLCREFFVCAVDGGSCTEFERIARVIVDEHILEEHRNATLAAFPDLGDPTAPGSASMAAREAVLGSTSTSSGSGDVSIAFS